MAATKMNEIVKFRPCWTASTPSELITYTRKPETPQTNPMPHKS